MVVTNLDSVNNPKSIHGLYPYRGKISAIDARNVLEKFDKSNRVLDPFCGSGTIVYEAADLGFKASIGCDVNLIAGWLTDAKLNCPQEISTVLEELEQFGERVEIDQVDHSLIERLNFYFHEQTSKEIATWALHFPEMSEYVKGVFCGAIALTARAASGYLWNSSSVGRFVEEKRPVSFEEKLFQKAKKHHYPLSSKSKKEFIYSDARELSSQFQPGAFDLVFTSPPYFDALDYTAYYAKIVFMALEVSVSEFKPLLLQKNSTYRDDMKIVLNEIVAVTTNNAKIVFVVGDKKLPDGSVINGGEFFSELLEHAPDQIIERSYSGSNSQIFDSINKTQRKEQIVIWDKSKW